MGVEIERKFLVIGDDWRGLATGRLYRQGYLSNDPQRVVRVRLAGDRGWLTVKGPPLGAGLSRAEFEYPVPAADAEEMLTSLCLQPLIEKRRYQLEYAGRGWEIDEFLGDNAGLIVAEIELEDERQAFAAPPWLGREVSHQARYNNARLAERPYRLWDAAERGANG